jgi:hypothetical protein
MLIKIFAILDKAKPVRENIRGLNLAAVKHTTVQVSRPPLEIGHNPLYRARADKRQCIYCILLNNVQHIKCKYMYILTVDYYCWLTQTQDRPTLPSERPPRKGQDCNCQTVINIWTWAPYRVRRLGRQTYRPSVVKWLWLHSPSSSNYVVSNFLQYFCYHTAPIVCCVTSANNAFWVSLLWVFALFRVVFSEALYTCCPFPTLFLCMSIGLAVFTL